LLAEGVAAICQASFAANQYADLLDLPPAEFEGQQFYSRFIATGRSANNSEEFIEIGERNQVTLERLGALLRLAQLEAGATQHHFAAVLDIARVRFLKRKQFWAPMIDREHDSRERAFHRSVLVEIVDDHLWIAVALQLDHDARIFIGLVANGAD